MSIVPAGLDPAEAEALRADRYLEALLAAAERRADDVPADPALDPALRATVRRLRDELVRVHPSFRFEERLGRRLAEAAARTRLGAGPASAGLIPLAIARAERVPDGALPPAAAPIAPTGVTAPDGRPWPPVARPLVIGGALTSAALSLAGVAYVAWRATRGIRGAA